MAKGVAVSESQLDTAESLAKFLNISVAYVRKLTRLNKLPVVRIGRAVRFDRASVLSALSSSAGERCCYCLQLINADDDAQRVSKREYAHTSCVFHVNNEPFAVRDAKAE